MRCLSAHTTADNDNGRTQSGTAHNESAAVRLLPNNGADINLAGNMGRSVSV